MARFETRNSCTSYCDWEIRRMFLGDAFENTGDGTIAIKKSGYYSILAQLHNKSGSNSSWMRTTIKINNSVISRR